MTTALRDDQRRDVEAHLNLVHYVLRKRRTPQNVYDDRFQDAVLGLMEAVRTYDAESGYAFSTWAVLCIRKALEVGRGREEGGNYRRAVRDRVDYERPASLLDEDVDPVDVDASASIDDLIERLSADGDGSLAVELGLDEDDVLVLTLAPSDAAHVLGITYQRAAARRRRLLDRIAA